MRMTLDEAIKRYADNAEYERTHGNLQGCMEFKQLAEWLRKYQKIEQILDDCDLDVEQAIKKLQDNSYELWKESYEVEHERNIRLEEKIKALEQQPCKEAVSREEAIKQVVNFYTNCERLKMFQQTANEVKQTVTDILRDLPPVTPRSLNPEADREESKAYCAECDHIEMCSWYPHDGCEWLKTDRYNAGYNAAKREIALSGEYEKAYERGKADAHPDINDGKMSEIPTDSKPSEDRE